MHIILFLECQWKTIKIIILYLFLLFFIDMIYSHDRAFKKSQKVEGNK